MLNRRLMGREPAATVPDPSRAAPIGYCSRVVFIVLRRIPRRLKIALRAGGRCKPVPRRRTARTHRQLVAHAVADSLVRALPHELRHSAVSLLSAAGLRAEDIADIVGHASIRMTADVYRHHVEPTITAGKAAMDAVFGNEPEKFGGQFGGQGQLFGS